MELPETIETINQRLRVTFGRFAHTDEPNYRVVWSEDMLEKRMMYTTDEGFQLLTPEVRIVKKYKYIHNKYILEKLLEVPQANKELTSLISYEPLFTFADKNNNALPPTWAVIELVIYAVHKAMNVAAGSAIYKEPEIMGGSAEATRERIEQIERDMTANETKIGDALAYDHAVGYGTRNRHDVN